LRGVARPVREVGVGVRPVALDVDREHGCDAVGAGRREQRDVAAE
jgi:hypothetical protein